MKKLIILSLLLAQAAWGITIPVSLTPGFHIETVVPLTDLNGMPLAGQTIEIDLPFTAGRFVRLFADTPTFYSLLVLLVNAEPGGFTSGQGAFLDSALNPIAEFPLGSAISSAPFVASVLSLPSLPSVPLDVYGVRYSVNLPSSAASIIGAELRLAGTGQFVVAPLGVPETGSTVAMLGLGVLGLYIYSAQRKSSLEH